MQSTFVEGATSKKIIRKHVFDKCLIRRVFYNPILNDSLLDLECVTSTPSQNTIQELNASECHPSGLLTDSMGGGGAHNVGNGFLASQYDQCVNVLLHDGGGRGGGVDAVITSGNVGDNFKPSLALKVAPMCRLGEFSVRVGLFMR